MAVKLDERESRTTANETLPLMPSPLRPLVDSVACINASAHKKLLAGFVVGALLLVGRAVLSFVVLCRLGARTRVSSWVCLR